MKLLLRQRLKKYGNTAEKNIYMRHNIDGRKCSDFMIISISVINILPYSCTPLWHNKKPLFCQFQLGKQQ